MVGWDSDVADLINLVETVGKQEEDSWNFIDTMAEVVKKGKYLDRVYFRVCNVLFTNSIK